jgi:hypothetical protein
VSVAFKLHKVDKGACIGATALMWATGDIAKVRLLLDQGG